MFVHRSLIIATERREIDATAETSFSRYDALSSCGSRESDVRAALLPGVVSEVLCGPE